MRDDLGMSRHVRFLGKWVVCLRILRREEKTKGNSSKDLKICDYFECRILRQDVDKFGSQECWLTSENPTEKDRHGKRMEKSPVFDAAQAQDFFPDLRRIRNDRERELRLRA
jgi:hypothetical protein